MYAEHRYTPSSSRGVSFGAALTINGALIAGLILAAPQIIPRDPPKILEGKNIPLPLPPVDPPKEQPKARSERAQSPQPNAPTPLVPTEITANTTRTDEVIYPPLPPQPPAADPGPIVEPSPPPPLPALVGAAQDPRYLSDFQPDYPAAELRASRDGLVSVRVLIGTDGRVKQIEQVSATSPAFFEATRRQALSRWRFKPATRGGVPQESWKAMSVRFRIADL